MERSKNYERVKFLPETIRAAVSLARDRLAAHYNRPAAAPTSDMPTDLRQQEGKWESEDAAIFRDRQLLRDEHPLESDERRERELIWWGEDQRRAEQRARTRLAGGLVQRDQVTLEVNAGATGTVKYDNEDEFFNAYRNEIIGARYWHWFYSFQDPYQHQRGMWDVSVDFTSTSWRVSSDVRVALPKASDVAALLELFDSAAPQAKLPKPKPRIFLGHGRNPLWREVQDSLRHAGYDVDTFEGARAGRTAVDVLVQILGSSHFAVLIHTGEDEQAGGDVRARQNVVHETGLFQGRLGFQRAVVVREDGTEPFSNLAGVQEIGFAKGNIREAEGQLLHTLRREFPPD